MRPLGTLPFQASAIRRLRKPKHCARKSPRFRQWLTQPPARSARRNEAPRAAYSPAGRLLVMRIHVACGPQSADSVEKLDGLRNGAAGCVVEASDADRGCRDDGTPGSCASPAVLQLQ